jgi:hypothetical protein
MYEIPNTSRVPSHLEFGQNLLVVGLIAGIPHPIPRVRFFAAVHATGSSWHTDSFRGPTVQVIMSLDPGYVLQVRMWPTYTCCVVCDSMDGEFYIPVGRMAEEIVMVGYGCRDTYTPCRRHVTRCDCTFHVFSQHALQRMAPVGHLSCHVLGVRKLEGDNFLPLCAPRFDPSCPSDIDNYPSPTSYSCRQFADLIAEARGHGYATDPRLQPDVFIGMVPYTPYMFVGWMQQHRRVCGSDARRVGMHFRPVMTPITSATLYYRPVPNWVDRRLDWSSVRVVLRGS